MAIGREILEGLGGGMAQISKDIRASRAKEATSKTPSLKDMLLLSYMNNKGDLDPNVAAAYGLTPDPAQVAGAAGQVQAPGQIGVQAGRAARPDITQAPQFGSLVDAAVAENVPVEAFSAQLANAGYDLAPGQKKALDLAYEARKQEMLMPGAVAEAGAKKEATEQVELESGAKKSQVTADYNLDVVSGALLPLSQTLANAYKEGGAGNVLKKTVTQLAQGGWLPEDMQEGYSESTAVSGKRIEVLLKMMPLMSSQYGKEGSTRIIKGVFDKLGESLPDLQNAPLNAIKMIDNSVDTLVGIVRAVNNVNLSSYDVNNDADRKRLIDKITLLSQNLDPTGEEKIAIDELKAKITGPIEAYRIAKKRGLI